MTLTALRLVEPIAAAVETQDPQALHDALTALHAAGVLAARELFAEPRADRYTRKLIHTDPEQRFVVVGMTWSPGQRSPLHDHAGLRGAEIVVEGTMRELVFEHRHVDPQGRHRFSGPVARDAGPGTVGLLAPPQEYHDFGNATDTLARSVHVYCGNLEACRTFTRTAEGSWTAREIRLAYDP